ncbi:hypothetical protein [Paraburkholderia sp. Clong3]|uniref:hypothetical protein n=1 Tax=Paraburkholderia sp. Clong3 TaxID=2991061 RepID=UPI003D207554
MQHDFRRRKRGEPQQRADFDDTDRRDPLRERTDGKPGRDSDGDGRRATAYEHVDPGDPRCVELAGRETAQVARCRQRCKPQRRIEAVIGGVPTKHAGLASGVVISTFQIGSALGVAIIGGVFYGALGESHAAARQD